MRKRRLLILPIIGLLLFVGESWHSYKIHSEMMRPNSCVWWANVPLDSSPLEKYSGFWRGQLTECEFEAHQFIDRAGPPWVTGLLELTAAPAFIAAIGISHGFGKIGVSEVTPFMVSAPPLIFAWYYFVAWACGRALNRWRWRSVSQPDV